jgi:hypothetical protein
MFMSKKRVLAEACKLIQWYVPLKDVFTDMLEKGSAHQDT